jgi:hypothetical protein
MLSGSQGGRSSENPPEYIHEAIFRIGIQRQKAILPAPVSGRKSKFFCPEKI